MNKLPVADLCLVSCVGKKLSARASAKDLCVSNWFLKVRALVETTGWPWFMLSTQYGLVDPEEIIEPYDRTLNNMRINERREWARGVLEDLERSLQGVNSVVFLAGQRYREFLEPALHERGIAVHVPMAHLGIGEQLSWLNQQLDGRHPMKPCSG